MLYCRVGSRSQHPPPNFPHHRPASEQRPVNILDEITADQIRTDLPELASGDTVRVSAKVVEGNR